MIVDTGVLYAHMDVRDGDHTASLRLLETAGVPLYVPTLVLGETAYLLEQRYGAEAEARLLAAVAAAEFILEHPTQPDIVRTAELVLEYGDWPLGTVDASVIATAERLEVTTIATLDRRHFGAVRPRHVERFELLP